MEKLPQEPKKNIFKKTNLVNLFLVIVIISCLTISLVLVSRKFPHLIPDFLTKLSLTKPSSSLPSPSVSSFSKSKAFSQNKQTPSFTSSRPLHHGKKSFSVSGGRKDAPLFSKGIIDPYDPQQGKEQVIEINIKSSPGVKSASLTMVTDNKKTGMAMKLIEGTEENGRWQAKWKVDDSYLYTYKMIIKASNGEQSQEIAITLR